MRPDPEPHLRQISDDHDAVLQLCDQVLAAAGGLQPELGEAQDAALRLLERATEHVVAEQELMHALVYPPGEAHAANHERLLGRVARPVAGQVAQLPADRPRVIDRDRPRQHRVQQWLSLIHISEPTRPY